MKNIDKIFIINEGVLELNKPELRNIAEFNAIITRDKGGKIKGDSDGRKKYFAFKELMYVYLYSSADSLYADLPDEARHLKAIESSDLPDGWKKDKVVSAACLKNIELQNLSSLRFGYINAKRAIYSTGEDIKYFNSKKDKYRSRLILLERQLEEIDATHVEDFQKLNYEVETLTTQMLQLSDKILALSSKLPEAYTMLKEFEKKLAEEQNQNAAIYGGGKLGNRER